MPAINTSLKVDDLKPGKALRLVISGHPIALIKTKAGAYINATTFQPLSVEEHVKLASAE